MNPHHHVQVDTQIERMKNAWASDARWHQLQRTYTAEEVVRLRPSVMVEHTIARRGAERFWRMVNEENYVAALGAMTGAQAVQMVKAGQKAIYVSGWQVAADANLSAQTYPDQSLYPSNSVPALVRRINNALMRADQIQRAERPLGHAAGHSKNTGSQAKGSHFDDHVDHGVDDWYAPILADAEAGFGGPLHAFELMKSMIEAGTAAVHFEDQLAAEKKCGHLGGKVLIPTSQFIRTLTAARLAADVLDVPTVIVARTDADKATLITSDIDPYDKPFLTGQRTSEGYFVLRCGLDSAIARGLAYAPFADLIWFETSTPDITEAQTFAEAIHKHHPGKILAYNCSPSFNWKKHLEPKAIASFQKDLGALGYRFQFITLAGWHLLNLHTFNLAASYQSEGMSAYVRLQEEEFSREAQGYSATRHQREVGTGYFDQVLLTITNGETSTAALAGSTESQQFGKST